jgi:transposase
VVACPLWDGSGARWCGCRPRGCLNRVPARCRWAHDLRVNTKSVYQWRRRWRAGGEAALASKGPGGGVPPVARAVVPAAGGAGWGPAVWGWSEDQRWTLARVTALIGRLFHVRYTLRGTSYLLRRIGFTPQVPVHRAAERDEDAIGAWRAVTWAKVRG